MRRVQPDGTVSVLNVKWQVPNPDPQKGVWVTLDLTPQAATLSIYDAAPDVSTRNCLAAYPFPLKEPVLPHPQMLSANGNSDPSSDPRPTPAEDPTETLSGSLMFWQWLPSYLPKPQPSQHLIQTALIRTAAFVQSIAETMY